LSTIAQATARANSNIAFIKYWGNQDDARRIPVNASISMNLDGLFTETTVSWNGALSADRLVLNGKDADGGAYQRVVQHLDVLRQRLGIDARAEVVSANNFPMGAGIASSASSFAALTLAGIRAIDSTISEKELTTLARLGSGSASRSIPDGFVYWHMGNSHESSYAESIAPADYWNLVDVIAVMSDTHKAVGSTRGHATAQTSDLQNGRLVNVNERLQIVKQAILDRDFASFAPVVEHDSNLMHAVMMTSNPALFYWMPTSLTVMDAVRQWRAEGLNVCYTLDAGPNVHCICTAEDAPEVARRIQSMAGVLEVLQAGAGGRAVILS
jgi:diphosphomevalonate decarboxylase